MTDTPGQNVRAAPRPARPIVIIGAGGIVRDAHLPAYRLAGYHVAGLYDRDLSRAEGLARAFGIETVYSSLEAAISGAPDGAVFDVAVPAEALMSILTALPDDAAVLIQKPFGQNLEEARSLRELCRRKRLRAAVNFQLRYAPYVHAARELIANGAIGELHDIDVRVTVFMPWRLWTFLQGLPRVEILYHSVHYIDLVRSFLGEPGGVHALTRPHPGAPELSSTRSVIALDYGPRARAVIVTNHGHDFGSRHQESSITWEGTRGAIRARMGLLLNYPAGAPDALEICQLDSSGRAGDWRAVPFEGSWYPHAFIGTMASVMRFAEQDGPEPATGVEDAFRTMAVVEAAYESSAAGATPIPS